MMRARWPGLLLILLACGPPSSQVVRLERPSGPVVHTGWYRGGVEFLPGDDPRIKRAEPWIRDSRCHEDVLRGLVRERFDAKSALEFRPMYVAADTSRDLVIVRWFARSCAPEEKRGIAGWEVLLLYTPRGRLVEAWVNELPLE
ncbi:hypothetical protein JXB37_03000 [candidate division WOR-3 bacterium]|nr:hypothetical protein [candidate division WOR-3 bacterium]